MSSLNTTESEPELVLLLECAKHYLRGTSQERIQQLLQQPELDWQNVLNLARFHRLLPILYKVFSSNGPIELPEAVLKELRDLQFRNITNNLVLLKELIGFLKILAAHDIRGISFKGPMTAMSAYGDLSLRTFSDLDVLVHPDDFLKLRPIALRNGYQCDRLMAIPEQQCLKQLSSHEQAIYFQSQKEYSLLEPKSRTCLDIHQGILSKHFAPLFDTRWIWQHTQTVDIGGHLILGVTPEVQVLVMVAQGAEDYWRQLGKLLDLAMLIDRHPDLDWHALLELAETLDILPRLVLGMSLVQQLYGLTLPDSVARTIQRFPSTQGLAQTVQRHILVNKPSHQSTKLTMGLVLYQLRLMTTWKNRVHCVLTLMNPTLADIAAMPLPKPLFFVYYLLRPVRLVQGFVRRQPVH
ncbi:nucleotidyltransferase domain-containing protein [Leptothoe sp. PORK10 BA2]|uniref:nucleotidyltransferase domain-containing protein n=1 Tax=Leptothoe sp. PORK10 BA2 TaxID=3110254 RepID=UPI002B21835A|nr:nucleotidyltransferase family protein [Leptothoe sp. PORK10 BA2]MEA5466117.1 nucleotidyltransferase family protein [Leptothoe sp. PORK10 BA2]